MAKRSSSKTGTLRVAMIGTGGIARQHLHAFNAMPDVKLVALADINEKVMREKSAQYDIPSDACFTDYHAMLREMRPDAVSVCTPNMLHAPASIAASEAGAHVIVEKPMAMTVPECEDMIAAADKAKRKLLCGFQFRFDPRTVFLKEAIDAGQLGTIMFARVQALRRRGVPNWGVFGKKELQGGGPMIDIGVHSLEMCHYLMGSPKPVAASGNTWTYLGNKRAASRTPSVWPNWDYKTYNVEDLAVGHIRFENGEVLHMETSFVAHTQEDKWDFELMGDKGGARWADSLICTDRFGHMVDITPGYLAYNGKPQFQDYFDMKLRDFVDHVLHGKPTINAAREGLKVQQMVDAIYQSAEQGGKEIAVSALS